MKANYTQPLVATSTNNNFSKLESLFGIKISPISHRFFTSGILPFVSKSSIIPELPTAILVTTDNQKSIISRLYFFIYSSFQYKYLKIKLSNLPHISINYFGVYPSIDNPFTIYQLGTSAESYANTTILPPIKHGFKGLILKAMKLIAPYHPSTAGIVILIQNKHA